MTITQPSVILRQLCHNHLRQHFFYRPGEARDALQTALLLTAIEIYFMLVALFSLPPQQRNSSSAYLLQAKK